MHLVGHSEKKRCVFVLGANLLLFFTLLELHFVEHIRKLISPFLVFVPPPLFFFKPQVKVTNRWKQTNNTLYKRRNQKICTEHRNKHEFIEKHKVPEQRQQNNRTVTVGPWKQKDNLLLSQASTFKLNLRVWTGSWCSFVCRSGKDLLWKWPVNNG